MDPLNCTEAEAKYSAALAHGPEKKLAEDWIALKAEVDRLKKEVEVAEARGAENMRSRCYALIRNARRNGRRLLLSDLYKLPLRGTHVYTGPEPDDGTA